MATAGRFAGLLGLMALAACGCDEPNPLPGWPYSPPEEEAAPAAPFDPARCGTVAGRVTWKGDAPAVPAFQFFRAVPGTGLIWGEQPNPNAPRVDEASRGLGGAVVFLRGAGLRPGRGWDHPPVTVEMRDFQIRVRQGDEDGGNVGFVRKGDAVEMVSRQAVLHSLRARGAAFFTLMFPDPERPLSRPLNHRGLVELSSATNYFWARAYLFVDDHPYYARTDARGNFTLPQVPEGTYELVCWVPNWRVARQERDPETAALARQWYADPAEVVRTVRVKAGESVEVGFEVGEAAFGGGAGR